MKLLPKSQPKNYWLTSKTWKVMKLTSILVIVLTLQVSAAVSSQNITFSGKNVAIKKVLNVIKNQTNYVFFYDVEVLKNVKPISLNLINAPIEKVLEQTFAGQPVTWIIEGKTISFVPKVEIIKEVVHLKSVEKQVKGKVTDEAGLPIPGANVRVKNGVASVQTDLDGSFTISVPSSNTILIISFMGMQTQEVIVSSDFLPVVLIAQGQKLDEIMVQVAYGTQKKKTLTGAQAAVSQKALQDRPITSLTTGLQGTMSGVTVTTTNGQPGKDGAAIKIRGIGTLNNSNPLVVVDGVIATMSEVNPSDVENVTVLKDAASSAIYGSRAANGVILVTTKKGKKGGVQIHFESNMGVQNLGPLPDYLPSWQQAEMFNQAKLNEGTAIANLPWSADKIQKLKDGSDPYNYPNTDWLDLFYKRAALQTNHYLSIGGGDGKSQYSFSMGYFDQNGNVDGLRSQKVSTRFNINTKVSDRFSISGNIAYQYMPTVEPISSYAPGFSSMLKLLNRISNTVVNQYPNGQYGYVGDGNPMAWLDSGSENKTIANTLTANFGADWEIVKNLHFKPALQYRGTSGQRKQFMEKIEYFSQTTGALTKTQGPNQLYQTSDKSTYYNVQALLDYKLNLGEKHHLSFLGGATKEYSLYEFMSAYRQDFLNNELTEINAGPAAGQKTEGYSNDWALLGYFGRFNYNYNERYLFEANYRYDGSSRFAGDNKWAAFPSFSAGWNISNEHFFEPLTDIVNSLKFRASWGQLGNQQASSNYPTYATVESGQNYSFNQSLAPGIAPNAGANADAKWETTTATDFGLDFSFLSNKLSFTVDYFTKMTDDILMTLPVGEVYGLSAPVVNAGSVSNKGWEFSGKYNANIGAVNLDLGANLTYIDNKITDLKGVGPIVGSGSSTFQDVGYPINSLYGYKAEGIFRSQQEVLDHATQGSNTAPGDLKYTDINNDGKIDSEDRSYLGTYFPKTTYGFNIGATYKTFEISAFFQGAAGVKANVSNMIGQIGGTSSKPTSAFLDNWTVDNPDASFPRLWTSYKQNDPESTPSSFWVKDASYLRLKALTIAFNFPESLNKKLGVVNAKIYYTGQNILTFTNFYSWIDPEVGSSASIYSYPQVVTNSIGLTVNF
ncbi:TonB-dependent receptor [Flavobacterium sp. LAR06]|uniref:TonB-dependent receptor n=1 Tax=Flavobacterium sp. LAR06 TaxID=3064897 RepID=UPI0035C184DC